LRQPPGPDRHGPIWPYPEVGRYTEAGGVRWHHLRLGTGPPLLLLHGSASSTHSWAAVASRVRSSFSLVIPDLPGHGYSSELPSDLGGPDDLARALGAFLRKEEVDPVLVAGHSAGAVLAIRAASRGWIAPRGILGVNPALGSRDTFLPPLLAGPLTAFARSRGPAHLGAALFRAAPLAELLLRSTGSRVSSDTRDRYRHLLADPRRVRGVLRLMADWDPHGVGTEAAALGIPVRFLTGSRDRWVPPRLVRAHAGGVPVEELPDRGHLLPEEDPDAVARSLRRLAMEAGVGEEVLEGPDCSPDRTPDRAPD
jgi:magnesium chelatase accessory protein